MLRCFLSMLVLVAFFLSLRAQTVVWNADFDAGFPAGMTRFDNDGNLYQGTNYYPDGWKVQAASSPFIYFTTAWLMSSAPIVEHGSFGDSIIASTSWYDPTGTSDDWLITPQLTIPQDGYLCFDVLGSNYWYSLSVSFERYDVRISTTGTNTSDFTTTLYDGYATPDWRNECLDLSAFAGQQVYIAFINDTPNKRYLFLDNIRLMQYASRDASAEPAFPDTWSAVNRPTYVNGVLRNFGNQAITSMDLKYSVNGGTPVSQALSGLNIAPSDTFSFEHGIAWNPSVAGNYSVKVWADNINGGADQFHANDTASINYTVYTAATERKSIIEIHGGDDCGPCKSLNEVLSPILDTWNANSATGNISALEYQTYNNDPSDNQDATTRTWRYGVTGFPETNVNGEMNSNMPVYLADNRYKLLDYDESWFSNQAAFMELDLDLVINGNTATVTVTINPLMNFAGSSMKLFIGISEDEYTWTGGLSGQTDYHHVLRKFLPDANGIVLGPMTAGTPVTKTESYTFTTGNVTEGSYNLWVGMNNIEAVAFVQDDMTDEIYQSVSRKATDPVTAVDDSRIESHLEIFPNPTADHAWLTFVSTENEAISIEWLDITGHSVRKISGESRAGADTRIFLNSAGLPKGLYLIRVTGAGGRPLGIERLVVQ